ncbi:hypothetical protein [Pseudomonas fluorescens]|uniref:hypothetical protein n=1 Tax=Pseudomonas fluorescens TaxID=294 RepID=UPI003D008C00
MTAQQKVLHKPELQEVVNGTLKLRELEDPLHALIRSYPRMLVGQKITLTVHPSYGVPQYYSHTVTFQDLVKKITIPIPKKVFEENRAEDFGADIDFSVEFKPGDVGLSDTLIIKVEK